MAAHIVRHCIHYQWRRSGDQYAEGGVAPALVMHQHLVAASAQAGGMGRALAAARGRLQVKVKGPVPPLMPMVAVPSHRPGQLTGVLLKLPIKGAGSVTRTVSVERHPFPFVSTAR